MSRLTTRRELLAATAGGTVAALAGCSNGGADSAGSKRDPRVVWKQAIPEVDGVAVADGAVFVLRPTAVEAYDAADGTRRWRTDIRRGSRRDLAVHGDSVFVDSSELLALDRGDGEPRWSVSESVHNVAGPVDGAFVLEVSDGLVAVDAATGEQRWFASATVPAIGEAQTLAVDEPHGPDRGSAVAGIGVEDGKEQWQYTEMRNLDMVGAVAGTAVVHATPASPNHRESVLGLGLADGSVRWEHDGPPTDGVTKVVLDDEHAVVVATEDWAMEVHAESGRQLWSHGADELADPTELVVGAERAILGYFESDEREATRLRCVDRGSGALAWEEAVPESVGRLVFDEQSLYVEAEGTRAIDPADGTLRWLASVPIDGIDGGRLYTVSGGRGIESVEEQSVVTLR